MTRRARPWHRHVARLLTIPALLCAGPAVTETIHPALAYAQDSTVVLERGDHGAQVKRLQRLLHVTADGAYGAKTERAVKRFQRENGLEVTGAVDDETAEALGLSDESSTTTTTAPSGPSGPTGPTGTTTEPGGDAATAVDAARSAIGTPYASGGTTTAGFDCSGLVQWAAKKAGLTLPRSSFDQAEEGTAVEQADIQAGDLVFFDTDGAGASHVGIATGPTKAVSATSEGVAEHTIVSGYWGDHYVSARRVF